MIPFTVRLDFSLPGNVPAYSVCQLDVKSSAFNAAVEGSLALGHSYSFYRAL